MGEGENRETVREWGRVVCVMYASVNGKKEKKAMTREELHKDRGEEKGQ